MKPLNEFSLIMIGAGRVGQTLASMCRQAEVRILALAARSVVSAKRAAEFVGAGRAIGLAQGLSELRPLLDSVPSHSSLLVVLATPDDALTRLADELATLRQDWQGSVVLHCSGGTAFEVLQPFQARGAEVGVLHPCYPVFQALTTLPRDRTVCYTFSGTEDARQVCEQLVASFKGVFISLNSLNPKLYHAGAMMASGHVVSLLTVAREVMVKSGLLHEQASQVVSSLVSGVLKNVLSNPRLEDSFSGPFVRGDEQFIYAQAEVISSQLPEILSLYKLLGERMQRLLRQP